MQTTGQAAADNGIGAEAHQLPAGEIKGLLQQMADRIAEADRRQAEVLGQMQERLAALGQEARGVRTRVPSEFSPAFERIEEGMALLANRIAASSDAVQHGPHGLAAQGFDHYAQHALRHHVEPRVAEAAPMPLRSALGPGAQTPAGAGATVNGIDTFDVVGAELPSESDAWDQNSADALARVYEASDTGLGRPAYDPDVSPARTPPHFAAAVERDWLDSRLAEVAKRIENSLTGSRSDDSLNELGRRFDQLEQRFSVALDNVATRSDVNGLRLVEAHISELVQQFEQAQGQFRRLDDIERQLVDLMDRLSDQRLTAIVSQGARSSDIEQMITAATERMIAASSATPPQASTAPAATDFEALAQAAAEEAVQRYAGHAGASRDNDHGLGELRGMIQSLADERRQGDETTASMLDTMQQAMIRVLDRIDAIEMNHATSISHFAQDRLSINAAAFAPTPGTRFASEPDLGGVAAPPVPQVAIPETRTEPKFDPVPVVERSSVAEVAPIVAAPIEERIEPMLGPVNDQMKQDFIAAARRARRNVAGQPAIRMAQPAPAAPEKPAARPQKPTASAAAPKDADAGRKVKESGAGLSFLKIPRKLFLGGTTAVLAVIIVALLMPRAHEITNGLLQSRSANVAANEAMPQSGTSDRLAVATDGRVSHPETVVADLSQSDQVDGVDAADRATTESGMPKGITLQSSADTPTPESLARANRQQQMANLSTELGAAAAASPAALVTEQSLGKPAGASQSALDLPPASVGPLSLRLAAAKGDPSAEFEVGARLAEGKGTSQNFAEAAKWYQRSAQQGFAQAQYRLGTLFERGLGQKADLQRARIWYKRAAEQGNVKAMHNLAVLSAGRQASAPDYATAAHWFSEAAQRGLTDSQFNLAVLYESGLGVAKDMKQAYKWFALSARSGDKESVKRRDLARGQLSAPDLDAAEVGLREWVQTPQDQMANDARAAGEAWKTRTSESNG